MRIKNLGVIKGKFSKIDDGKIIYSPQGHSKIVSKSLDDKYLDEIRSSESYSQGTLEFKMKAESSETCLLLIWDEEGNIDGAIGHSFSNGRFQIGSDNGVGLGGGLRNYKPNQELKITIKLIGSMAKLFVNDVLQAESNFVAKNLPIQFRMFSKGKIEISDITLDAVRPKLFVVMQFSEDYNNLYDEVIKPVAEKSGFDCIRADEYYTSTPILTDIIKSIEESHAIIAEITPDNPNVFYEIGYAHAIKKPTILLCDKKREKLPFDVSSFRTLFYVNSIAGKSAVERNLKKYLENIK